MKHSQHIPKWPERLLRAFCSERVLEYLQGDVYELYEIRLKRLGKFRAQLYLILDVLSAFRPLFFKSNWSNSNTITMLKYNLILAIRGFKRYKSTFFINLTGLSIGLVSVLMIYLWVHDEMSFDKFHVKKDRLYQVMTNTSSENGILTHGSTSTLLPDALRSEIPEVEYVVPVRPMPVAIISSEEVQVKASGQFAGKNFFDVFTYKILVGNQQNVLQDKYSMVISEELAIKLFGTPEKSLGKSVEWKLDNFGGTHIISGVWEKPKQNSSAQFDFLVSHEAFLERSRMDNSWDSNPIAAYLTLKPDTNLDLFNSKLSDFYNKKRGNDIAEYPSMFLQKFSDKYLYGRYENGKVAGGRIDYVILFSIVAIFILVIACINFMNLSTAQASKKQKEVGIKKAFGISRIMIAFQYISESILLSALSLVVALVVGFLLLPEFNHISGKQLTMNGGWVLFLFGFCVVLITGLISGSYPAFYLSGMKAVEILKGKLHTTVSELWIRKGLVVFQFSISVLLIVGVLVVYKQMNLVQNKNLGFSKEHVITFSWPRQQNENMQLFLEQVRNTPGIINTSSTSEPIINVQSTSSGHGWEGQQANEEEIQFTGLNVNYNISETLDIELAEGRLFSKEFASDRNAVVLNETAINAMGLTDPVGQWMELFGMRREIIGVVKDFHFQSMHESIKPMFMVFNPGYAGTINIRLNANSENGTIATIESLYQSFNVGVPFEFNFLDDSYQNLYESEMRVSGLSKYFASVAIVLSCLGLFGLATFTAERRTKEIGIRKILGLSVFGIVKMLTGDFSKMVLVAIIISLPLAYFMAEKWLDGFAYHVDLEWWFFAVSGLATLTIALITVGWQTLKVAQINPSDCLRDG
ncbi:ABC transporter permease [Reichenbachiella sp. MALMAid0571]|uniref:ABC transporter permease n=1 Tax=Reichenbachiella sp. MALMAid0571 TaxID=3143939 RepID=UPI0032E052F8